MRKTKIVCTIGPKSESKEVLAKLVNAGMNVMRLNFSHGDFDEHGGRIKRLKEIMSETGKKVAILLDTKGPEIRTMSLENGEDVLLELGQEFTLTTDQSFVGNKNKVAVTYTDITKDLKKGDTILLDDGLIALEVIEVVGDEVKCKVNNNGELGENKGVNLPGVNLSLPALAEKDKGDLIFGAEQDVDFIAASFIRKKEDVIEIRNFLDENGGKNIKIISKIENQEGIDNFDEILELSDGIMVARGDLGVEIPIEEVPFAQKYMIERCNEAGKMVITATQMLDSMIRNPRPTRAEAGDVANAILDGTDAVMLSGESAKGRYPEMAVTTMAKICKRADEVMGYYPNDSLGAVTIAEAVSKGAVEAAEILNAKLIIVSTETGQSALNVRKNFPTASILAVTSNEKTSRQLMLAKGIYTCVVPKVETTDEFYKSAEKIAVELKYAEKDDLVVMIAGVPVVDAGTTNMFKVHVIGQ